MSLDTKIEWAHAGLGRGASWNPVRARRIVPATKNAGAEERIGWHCTPVSDGCKNCYASTINLRLGTGLPYKPGHERDIEIFLDEKMLLKPLTWPKPTGIFVGSMTDLFADFVTDDMLDRIFAVAALCPQHRFLFLTKRPARMRAYLTQNTAPGRQYAGIGEIARALGLSMERYSAALALLDKPLPNVWCGVSVEDQSTADERIPDLLATPAAIRFVSYEPALGPIDFLHLQPSDVPVEIDALNGTHGILRPHRGKSKRLDLVIAGGESGPHARPAHPDWFRSVRDQCQAAGGAFFFTQWGEWAPSTPDAAVSPRSGWRALRGGLIQNKDASLLYPENGAAFVEYLGKKAAGRTLDGRTWDEMPEVLP